MVRVARCVTYNQVTVIARSCIYQYSGLLILSISCWNVWEFSCYMELFLCCYQVVGIFGFKKEDHIGKVSFPPVQVLFQIITFQASKLAFYAGGQCIVNSCADVCYGFSVIWWRLTWFTCFYRTLFNAGSAIVSNFLSPSIQGERQSTLFDTLCHWPGVHPFFLKKVIFISIRNI